MRTAERIAHALFAALAALAVIGAVAALIGDSLDTAIICGVTAAVFAGAAGVAWVSGRRG